MKKASLASLSDNNQQCQKTAIPNFPNPADGDTTNPHYGRSLLVFLSLLQLFLYKIQMPKGQHVWRSKRNAVEVNQTYWKAFCEVMEKTKAREYYYVSHAWWVGSCSFCSWGDLTSFPKVLPWMPQCEKVLHTSEAHSVKCLFQGNANGHSNATWLGVDLNLQHIFWTFYLM